MYASLSDNFRWESECHSFFGHKAANAVDLPQRSLLRRYAEGNFQWPLALARITDQPLAVLALKATGKKLPNIFRKLQR
jgi:hypothetical protein